MASTRVGYDNNTKWEKIVPNVQGIVFYLDKKENVCACFHGRRSKPTWLYRFPNYDKMILKIDEAIGDQFKKIQQKEQLKKEKSEKASNARAKVQIGDIFHTSWGYDHTNTEFFQVIERVSPAKVKIRQIRASMSNEGYMSCQVTPIKDSFQGDEKVCTINYRGNISKADAYGNCGYPCEDGKSYYKSWYA